MFGWFKSSQHLVCNCLSNISIGTQFVINHEWCLAVYFFYYLYFIFLEFHLTCHVIWRKRNYIVPFKSLKVNEASLWKSSILETFFIAACCASNADDSLLITVFNYTLASFSKFVWSVTRNTQFTLIVTKFLNATLSNIFHKFNVRLWALENFVPRRFYVFHDNLLGNCGN